MKDAENQKKVLSQVFGDHYNTNLKPEDSPE